MVRADPVLHSCSSFPFFNPVLQPVFFNPVLHSASHFSSALHIQITQLQLHRNDRNLNINGITPVDQAREDVWYVMSDLFLDTELLERDIQYIAKELAASHFSVGQLISIFEDEVAPVLHGNLKVTAGIWGCFSRDEIIPLIRRRALSLTKEHRKGLPIIERMKRAYVLGETIEEWKQILKRIEQIRSGLND
jgi:hypothetical protein